MEEIKGFIEVTINGSRVIINLSSVTDFLEYKGKMYVGFTTTKDDFAELEESYEQIKELIINAQK